MTVNAVIVIIPANRNIIFRVIFCRHIEFLSSCMLRSNQVQCNIRTYIRKAVNEQMEEDNAFLSMLVSCFKKV
jgi:hypothetical protein